MEALNGASSFGPSIMVEAGAGCAKTTTLELASQNVRAPALAVAFNKRIADEMGKRLPGNFICKTMNSLGHAAWGRFTGLNLRLDDRKIGKLISEVARGRRMDLTSDQWDTTRLLIREAQIQGLVPRQHETEASLIPDTPEGWSSLLSSSSADIDLADFEFVWEIAREVLARSIDLARAGVVSFDDQIYCSTMLGGRFGKFPVLFVDEDQDLNPLQIQMLSLSTRPDTKLMAVGDKHQSIYAFRGAVGEAAEQIRLLRPQWTDLPLMTSFRVPQLVALRQRAHVPLFRAHGANPAGRIKVFSGEAGWSWQDVVDNLPEPDSPIAILCRNNSPIISMAFKLIRQGIGCFILGRDISKGLVALTKKLSPADDTSSDTIRGRIREWQASEESKASANDKPELIERIVDKAECLIAVLDGSEAKDAGQLRRQLDRLFSRENGLVALSTIHRAKGLEWPAVLHLDPWRIPSKFARGNDRAMAQEANLRYVCETRTKHTLLLGSIEDFHP